MNSPKQTMELGTRQLRRFLYLPLTKLIGGMIVFTSLSIFWFNVKTENLALVIGLTWAWVSLVHIFPLLVLAFNHYNKCKNVILIFDQNLQTFLYRNNKIELEFNFVDIARVEKVVSPPKYHDRVDLLGFGYFFYWMIHLKSGAIIPLSCMLINEDKIFDRNGIELVKRIFPIIPTLA